MNTYITIVTSTLTTFILTMEKRPTDHRTMGSPTNTPAGDGSDHDTTYDTGFKYQIPEADTQQPPNYKSQSQSQYLHHGSAGDYSTLPLPSGLFPLMTLGVMETLSLTT
jgi:hypothetical protein